MATCSNIKKYTYLYMRAGFLFVFIILEIICLPIPLYETDSSDHLMILQFMRFHEIFLLFCYINYTFVLIKIVSFLYLLSSLGIHLGMGEHEMSTTRCH